ncbi:hypothetical protein [Halosegnis sp.]|uniref:DUF7095 family protein n=1 Tax=Halosegnis sp. TaxID=2864959 RepID=UPI0035D45796
MDETEGLARKRAVERVEEILETVRTERLPVPVREVWVYGDVVLGLDPVPRVDVYVTKDLLFKDAPDREATFIDSHGIEGVGRTVRADWAEANPELLRANENGHAAPERCLAAQLLPDDEPVHLEVCNTGFEDNVTRRLEAARAREEYRQLLDPRAAMLWAGDGDDERVSESALEKLRANEFVFPTLSAALEMLGLDEAEAERAAETVREGRRRQSGSTVRGDVV